MKGKASKSTVSVEWFFDRERVMTEVDKGTLGALKSSGSYVRKSAQNSIKKGRPTAARRIRGEGGRFMKNQSAATGTTPSAPGTPPNTKRGFQKKNTFYAYDPVNRSVVIGPLWFPVINNLIEFGGSAQYEMWANPKGRTCVTLGKTPQRGGPWKHIGSRMQHYPARPYMFPALERSQQKIASFFGKII